MRAPDRPWPFTVVALLLLLCGLAASPSGSSPALASPDAGGAVASRDGGPPAVAAVRPLPVFDAGAAAPPPAMRRTGSNAEGWATYRLAPGRVPDRLAPGAGFRGEISWVDGGLVRKARVYVPRSVPAVAPLLVSLHGLSGTLRKVEAQQRWSTLAFQQGAVVVWAAGHEGSWNAGPCCGTASRDRVDDLRYLDRLLQVAGSLQAVDRRRVFLAGYSNGAMMAYRYACGRPGRIAGVLAVAGTHTAPCRPTAATAVLVVHGAQDPTVPLSGGLSRELRTTLPPARRAADLWAALGSGVRSVVLPGFAHGWPRAADGYDATGQGWRFLIEHPQPS